MSFLGWRSAGACFWERQGVFRRRAGCMLREGNVSVGNGMGGLTWGDARMGGRNGKPGGPQGGRPSGRQGGCRGGAGVGRGTNHVPSCHVPWAACMLRAVEERQPSKRHIAATKAHFVSSERTLCQQRRHTFVSQEGTLCQCRKHLFVRTEARPCSSGTPILIVREAWSDEAQTPKERNHTSTPFVSDTQAGFVRRATPFPSAAKVAFAGGSPL